MWTHLKMTINQNKNLKFYHIYLISMCPKIQQKQINWVKATIFHSLQHTRLWDGQLRNWVLTSTSDFLLSKISRLKYQAYEISCWKRTGWRDGTPSSKVKWPMHEADNSFPSSAQVNNAWNDTSTSAYILGFWLMFESNVHKTHSLKSTINVAK